MPPKPMTLLALSHREPLVREARGPGLSGAWDYWCQAVQLSEPEQAKCDKALLRCVSGREPVLVLGHMKALDARLACPDNPVSLPGMAQTPMHSADTQWMPQRRS